MQDDEQPISRSRRALLKSIAAAGVATYLAKALPANAQSSLPTGTVAPSSFLGPGKTWRGVNLGSWLVLEKWMAPSAFAGTDAADEYTLCQALGSQAKARLQAHRDRWITDDDFSWIAARGLNTVRLPVGYWVLEGDAPYVAAPDTLDRAFTQAARHGLSVLLDLHGAPGSQNGWDHSGRAGALLWPTNPAYIAKTLDVVEGLAVHCQRYPNLIGVELLNEPRWDVPIDTLKSYYQEGYSRVRKHLPASVAVVIHDGFRPREWGGFMQEPGFTNVVLDTHRYQCYTKQDSDKNVYEHIGYTVGDLQAELGDMQKQELPTLIGEWSGALNPDSLSGLEGFSRSQAIRAYANAQITAYESTRGWLYWSYKLEGPSDWSFRHSVDVGLLPSSYSG